MCTFQSVEEPQSEKDLRQGEEAFPLPKGHEGPIEWRWSDKF